MRCDLCGEPAVTFVRYNGAHLCAEHFCAYVERRIRREVRREASLERGDTVGVAVSGGKDSMVTLSILSELFGERNGIRLVCISLDEGIAGYRPPSLEIVKDFCAKKGIEYRQRSFSEMSLSMDEVAPISENASPCTYCGVFRRKLMNDEARKCGCTCLATGHNLDDMAQSIMMNFARGDIERLARLGPHKDPPEGMVPRIYPLRMVTEKESLLYSVVKGVPHWDGECPYWQAALRNEYRDIVDGLEDRTPGAKFSILSSYDKLRPMLTEKYPRSGMGTCACGEPCNGSRCKACEFEELLRKKLGKNRRPSAPTPSLGFSQHPVCDVHDLYPVVCSEIESIRCQDRLGEVVPY